MKFLAKVLLSAILRITLLGLLLFIPAGTSGWRRAWIFLGLLFAGLAAAIIALWPGHKELLQERFLKPPVQKEQPPSDKVALLLFLATFFGLLVFTSLDVFRFRLLAKPGPIASFLGLFLVACGLAIIFLTLRENAFAAPVVKHQKDRQQRVVDTGPYRAVRHPLYAGGILILAGIPLWLESYAGLLAAIIPASTLAVRAVLEERFLSRKLDGYDAYRDKVRFRLIPFLW